MPFGDSGGSKTQTTTSSSAPWAPTQPGLKQGIKDWDALYKSGGLSVSRYPGSTLADTAPETSAGWSSITNTANDPSKGVGAAQDYNNAILRGDYSALQPMFDAARDNAGMSYEAAGRYGSGYHDNAVSKGVGSVIAGAAGQAVAAAPGLQQAAYVPGQALLGVGQDREQTAQQQIDEAIKAYNYDKTQQAQTIQQYLAGLQGNYGGQTVGTQPAQTNGSNPWLQGAGIAASALGSYFGSQ